jgi:hypothetical protein
MLGKRGILPGEAPPRKTMLLQWASAVSECTARWLRIKRPKHVNDFETAAERIECRGVVHACGLLAEFREG